MAKIRVCNRQENFEKGVFNLEEAAAYLRVAPATLAKGLRNGSVRVGAKRIGRRYVIARANLDKWLADGAEIGTADV